MPAVPKTAWEGREEQEAVPVHQWQQESGEGSREMLAPLLGQSWDCAG